MRKKKRIYYRKLVRDKIPDVIRKDGGVPETRILDDHEFGQVLIEKLYEEASELMRAKDRSEELEELADISEVFYAIMHLKGITKHELFERQLEKMREKGRFDKRIFLEWVDEKEGK